MRVYAPTGHLQTHAKNYRKLHIKMLFLSVYLGTANCQAMAFPAITSHSLYHTTLSPTVRVDAA